MLILILALVVLSLGQTENPSCTCGQGSGDSVFVDGAAVIAVPSADNNFHLDEKPADLSQSGQFVASITNATALAQLLALVPHSVLVGYYNAAQAKVDEINATIAKFEEWKAAFDADVNEALNRISDYWDDHVESARLVNDFRSAYRWLLDVWQIEARQRFIDRATRWLAIRREFLAKEKPLRESERDLLQKLVALSQGIEDAVTACGSGPTCTRALQTPIVLATNPSNVTEILAAQAQYVPAVQSYNTDLVAKLKDSLVDFVPRDQTDEADNTDRAWFWDIQTKIENYTPPTWDDIKSYVQNIVNWQVRILARFFSYVRDYEFSAYELTTDETDPEQIIITVVGTIVSNTSADLNAGVERAVNFARAVLYAYTGAYRIVVTKDGDVDVTGRFSIKATITKIKQEIIRETSERPLNRTIAEIIAAAKARKEAVIASVSDVATEVEAQRDTTATDLTDAYTALSASINDTDAALDERAQKAVDDLAAQVDAEGKLTTVETDLVELSSVIRERVEAYRTNWTEDFNASVSAYQNAWEQAECEERQKLIAYLNGKIEKLNNEADDTKVQYWAATEAGLANAYEAACISREHAEERYNETSEAAADAKTWADEYLAWFNAKYDKLTTGVSLTVAEARDEINANLDAGQHDFETFVQDAIISVKGSDAVQDVAVTWDNVADQAAGTIEATIDVLTDPSVVIDEAHHHQVRLCIRAAIAIGCQNEGVTVTDVTPLKRQTGNSSQYKATVVDQSQPGTNPTMTPPVDPASPTPPTTPTTPTDPASTPTDTTVPTGAPGSSASSLIFSFATLAVCLLVLF